MVDGDNFATVHIARPSGYSGCAVRMTIQLDNDDFYWLACGEHISFRVPADKQIIVSQTTSHVADHVEIDTDKGEEFFFENDCNGFACWLQEVKEARFTKLLNRCGPEIKIGY
ncbi:hypothetical protein FO488_03400 [Geobacter sp. FeAm09]|uniref:hypothetical protein n=1 Tax=Geobacter sp. FeAm09 TaxID=2597769 RepID=UPI0011EF1F49|nr:hypothetical protein [Geobacter sp. FeAm09]QEM67290.1 hypothetical protein FO488_03400 [Geobacter sp. FeAm09]